MERGRQVYANTVVKTGQWPWPGASGARTQEVRTPRACLEGELEGFANGMWEKGNLGRSRNQDFRGELGHCSP